MQDGLFEQAILLFLSLDQGFHRFSHQASLYLHLDDKH
jgi:hypothetical protein